MDQKPNRYYLYFSAITANILCITTGSGMVWTAPVIPKFLSNDTSQNPLGAPISVFQVSMLTCINPTAFILGTITLGKLPDMIGRKNTIILLALGITILNVSLYFAKYLYQFVILLFLVTITQSLVINVVPMYTAEIAEDSNRGGLVSLYSLLVIIGQLYCFGFSSFTSVNLFFCLCAIPSLIVLLVSPFISESPIYHLLKGDKQKAIKTLTKLGKTAALKEMDVESIEKQHMIRSNVAQPKIYWKNIFLDRSARKGLLLSMALVCFFDLSGVLIILNFITTILKDVGTYFSPEKTTIIIFTIKIFVAFFATTFVVDKIRRRSLVLTSYCICGLAMFVLGLYFYFTENKYELPQFVRFIPVIAIACFVCTFTMGISSLSTVFRTELLPNEHRSLGCSINLFVGNIVAVIILFTYPLISRYVGIHYCMFIFSFCCFGAFIFLFYYLPETKGKSFSEIKLLLER